MKMRGKSLLLVMLVVIATVLQPLQLFASDVPSAYAGKTVYDVTEYGADKEGMKDSSTAFQSAISEARQEGGDAIVFIPEGTYLLESQMRLEGDNVIVADEKAVIKTTAALGFWMIGNDITVDGGKWIGTKDFNQNVFKAQRGVNGISLQNMTISDAGIGACFSPATAVMSKVTVSNCKNRGVLLMNGATVTLKKCTIKDNGAGYYSKSRSGDCGHGVGVQNSTLTMEKGSVSGSTQCGISLVSSTLDMKGTTIKKNSRNGIGTFKKCTVKIDGGTIKNNGYDKKTPKQSYQGISATAGSSMTIKNCTISSNKGTGIYMVDKGTNVKCKNVTFVKNSIAQILMEKNTKLTLEGCTLKHSTLGIRKNASAKVTLKKTNTENGKKIKKIKSVK